MDNLAGKKIVFRTEGKVEIDDFEISPAAMGEVAVETLYSVVSPGTERASLSRAANSETEREGFPHFPGYSSVGRVVGLGPEVSDFHVGQLVAMNAPHTSHINVSVLSRDRVQFGAHSNIRLWPLPTGFGSEMCKDSAVFMLSVIALSGIRRARIEIGEPVLIIGLGPIGLCAAEYARLCGAFPVVGYDVCAARRARAIEFGFESILDKFDGESIRQANDAPAVVIDATGSPQATSLALSAVRTEGRVILLGSPRGTLHNFNFYEHIHRRSVTVIGAHQTVRPTLDSYPGHWTKRLMVNSYYVK